MNEEQIKALIAAALKDFGTGVVPGLMASAMKPLGDQMTGIASSLEALKPQQTQQQQTQQTQTQQTQQQQTQQTQQAQATPQENAAILELRKSNEKLLKDMETLTQQRQADQKRADDAERMSVVNGVLGGFQFATDAARQTAVEKILPQLKRMDDGSLVAGNNLTPESFIKDFLPTQHAYLLAPVNAGGAGVIPGTGNRGPQVFDLDKIKPGMSPEDRAAAVASITQAGANLNK